MLLRYISTCMDIARIYKIIIILPESLIYHSSYWKPCHIYDHNTIMNVPNDRQITGMKVNARLDT